MKLFQNIFENYDQNLYHNMKTSSFYVQLPIKGLPVWSSFSSVIFFRNSSYFGFWSFALNYLPGRAIFLCVNAMFYFCLFYQNKKNNSLTCNILKPFAISSKCMIFLPLEFHFEKSQCLNRRVYYRKNKASISFFSWRELLGGNSWNSFEQLSL